MTALRPARITFDDDGAAHAPDFGDRYHPRIGAAAQAQHVFLAGNHLPARWAGTPGFTILETGFGLGHNFLATWDAWRRDPARGERLHFISIEAHPPTRKDLQRGHVGSPWPDLAATLHEAWPPLTPGLHALTFEGGRVRLLLALGDVQAMQRQIDASVDAYFLDGFAPDRNPAMWDRHLLQALARKARPGATAATWSVAREVHRRPARRGLRGRARPRGRRQARGHARTLGAALVGPAGAANGRRRPPGGRDRRRSGGRLGGARTGTVRLAGHGRRPPRAAGTGGLRQPGRPVPRHGACRRRRACALQPRGGTDRGAHDARLDRCRPSPRRRRRPAAPGRARRAHRGPEGTVERDRPGRRLRAVARRAAGRRARRTATGSARLVLCPGRLGRPRRAGGASAAHPGRGLPRGRRSRRTAARRRDLDPAR